MNNRNYDANFLIFLQCCVCHQEAPLHCCRNTNYCSQACKDEDRSKHKLVCQAANAVCEVMKDASQRPKRIIKPKIYWIVDNSLLCWYSLHTIWHLSECLLVASFFSSSRASAYHVLQKQFFFRWCFIDVFFLRARMKPIVCTCCQKRRVFVLKFGLVVGLWINNIVIILKTVLLNCCIAVKLLGRTVLHCVRFYCKN